MTRHTYIGELNTIAWAVWQLRRGEKVRRAGWNGKGMWLWLDEAHDEKWQPFVVMHTAQGTEVPWLCSQTDLLATDWEAVQP